jgi:hypothetical protein
MTKPMKMVDGALSRIEKFSMVARIALEIKIWHRIYAARPRKVVRLRGGVLLRKKGAFV